jgi:type II secretory pathway component GspD/PulD (secretin)
LNARKTIRRCVWLGACLLALAFVAQAQQQVLEVITLGYRQADDVIPVLRPLLAPGGTLTGTSNRLIVRTTPANLAELKQVLAIVDSRPRQLVISVRQGSVAEAGRDRSSISGAVGVGNNAQVTVPPPPDAHRDPGVVVQSDRSRIEGRALSSASGQDSSVTQTVRVLEGNSAFIRTGQSVPVTNTQTNRIPGGNQITQSTDFVNVDTGFYATPRVSGDRVTIEIGTARDRVRNPATGAVNIQRASTVVSGRLGEWIAVGGSGETTEKTRNELLSQRRDSIRDERTIMLKVEEAR